MWISIRDGFQCVVNVRKVEYGGSVLRAPIKTLAVLRKSAACSRLDGVLKGALIPIAERKHGETAPSKYVARNRASVGNTRTSSLSDSAQNWHNLVIDILDEADFRNNVTCLMGQR